ncbi:hypothetical protein Pelo_11428 [Pelomyxa schiedti]|nr:hypothetical protein Pelo_11428 [Pelomyxa schiedti]
MGRGSVVAAVLVVAAVVGTCSGATVMCGDTSVVGTVVTMIPVPNKCVGTPLTPFCVLRKGVYVCAACESNCDCPIGQYCVKEEDSNVTGSCVALEEDILGKPCNQFLLALDRRMTVETPVKGVNEELVCGKPIFNSTGGFVTYDWLGYCEKGVCVECPNLGEPVIDFISFAANPSALLCPGRECKMNKVQQNAEATKNVLIDIPQGISAAILAFVIIITFLSFFMCFGIIQVNIIDADPWATPLHYGDHFQDIRIGVILGGAKESIVSIARIGRIRRTGRINRGARIVRTHPLRCNHNPPPVARDGRDKVHKIGAHVAGPSIATQSVLDGANTGRGALGADPTHQQAREDAPGPGESDVLRASVEGAVSYIEIIAPLPPTVYGFFRGSFGISP